MRAIDSALALSRNLNTRLNIYWVRGSDLNCPFHLLFEPFADTHVQVYDRMIRPLRFIHTHPNLFRLARFLHLNNQSFSSRENDRLLNVDWTTLTSGKPIIIESLGRFYANKDRYTDFKPIQPLAQRISARTAQFDKHTVGVHVRRTDNVKSIIMSPDDLFIAQMQHELEEQPLTRFYLATDSLDVKKKFTHIFGNLIITTPDEASRTTFEGVQEAVVELYALAGTSKILGSFWSTYSSTAAELGNIKMVRIKAETKAL